MNADPELKDEETLAGSADVKDLGLPSTHVQAQEGGPDGHRAILGAWMSSFCTWGFVG